MAKVRTILRTEKKGKVIGLKTNLLANVKSITVMALDMRVYVTMASHLVTALVITAME